MAATAIASPPAGRADEAVRSVQASELRLTARSLGGVILVAGLAWLGFYAFSRTYPFVFNGSYLIGSTKRKLAATGPVFSAPADVARMAVFGHSQILSGFVPARFDALADGRVQSFNFGVPGTPYFLPLLKPMLQRGEVPKYVLMVEDWRKWPPPGPAIDVIDSDEVYLRELFPFRDLGRDVLTFLINSRQRGGISAYYDTGRRAVSSMLADRGFYFIEGQSRYKNHELPASFSLPTDRPELTEPRKAVPGGPHFDYLRSAARQYGFKIFMIPSVRRVGERAPLPAINSELAERLKAYPEFRIVGPDYLVLENRYFSDPAHLNPQGAAKYTETVYELMREYLP